MLLYVSCQEEVIICSIIMEIKEHGGYNKFQYRPMLSAIASQIDKIT